MREWERSAKIFIVWKKLVCWRVYQVQITIAGCCVFLLNQFPVGNYLHSYTKKKKSLLSILNVIHERAWSLSNWCHLFSEKFIRI